MIKISTQVDAKDVEINDIPGASYFTGKFRGQSGLFYKTSLYGVVFMNDPSIIWAEPCSGLVLGYRPIKRVDLAIRNDSHGRSVSDIPNSTTFYGSMGGFEGLFLKTSAVLLHFSETESIDSNGIYSWSNSEFDRLQVKDYRVVDVEIKI